jgi:hypothetical protein
MVFGVYDDLVSHTVLHTVLPFISLDLLVQRYLALRERNQGTQTGAAGFSNNPKDSPAESSVSKGLSELPSDPPDGFWDRQEWRFRRWWLSALAWLGLEES